MIDNQNVKQITQETVRQGYRQRTQCRLRTGQAGMVRTHGRTSGGKEPLVCRRPGDWRGISGLDDHEFHDAAAQDGGAVRHQRQQGYRGSLCVVGSGAAI